MSLHVRSRPPPIIASLLRPDAPFNRFAFSMSSHVEPMPPSPEEQRPRTLVLGGSGYVGGRLIPVLERAGVTLRCLARDPDKLRPLVAETTEVVRGDVLDAGSLGPALAGVQTVYYLVHLMAASKDFERDDRLAATNV